MRRVLAGLVAVLALTGCAGRVDSGTGPVDPDRPTEASVQPVPSDGLGPTGEPEELVAGLVDVRARPWDRAEPIEDGRAVRLHWAGGLPACDGLDRVEVAEHPDMVVLTLYVGTVPDAGPCPEIAVFRSTEVRLTTPLGDRRIVDGAA